MSDTVYHVTSHTAKHGPEDHGLYASRERAEYNVRMWLDDHLIEFTQAAPGVWEYEYYTITERLVRP